MLFLNKMDDLSEISNLREIPLPDVVYNLDDLDEDFDRNSLVHFLSCSSYVL